MNNFELTLVRSKIKNRPYCKIDGKFAGPTWKNDIGIQSVPYNIEAVFKLCQQLADDSSVCMVYGTAVKSKITNTDRTMQNFTEEPVWLLTLDLDRYKGGLKDEYPTYPEAVNEADKFIQQYLPPEFRNTSYILRFSSSFLFKDHNFRSHIVFLLEDSQYPREIGTWIKQENIQTDPTFYFNLTQPVFTAAPIWKQEIDPLKKIDGYFPRVSLVKKDIDVVPAGWQPYSVKPKEKFDQSNMPDAVALPGKVGSFCRKVPIEKALQELGYEIQEDGRYLAPTSETGLPGVIVFDNGYCYTHHSDDPISVVADKIYNNKRSSFNSYDLLYGWARANEENFPDLMNEFQFMLSESVIADQVYQDELISEFLFRTEWLMEDGYVGDNKTIVDTLLYDISGSYLNEMSRNYILETINSKTKKGIKVSELKRAWSSLQKDSAYYKNQYDPEAGLRVMADLFIKKQLVFSEHSALRGDFWCYYNSNRMWKRLNRDQTNAYIYKHLHEALPIKVEIPISKVKDLTTLILSLVCEKYSRFKPGKGWAFKGGKIGIRMDKLFTKGWTVTGNTLTIRREHRVVKELPITYEQWKSARDMPDKFNDFLISSCEEDYGKMELLQEFIGYVFADSYYLHNFMVLEGVPGSGKSILIKIIRSCLSSQYFTAISLNRMGTQFGLAELPGKQLAIMSEAREINFNQLRSAIPVILKMVGNDPIDVEAKHKVSTTEILNCKLMIVTNRTPIMPDDTGALTQRMIMVRFHKSFRGTDEEILGLDEDILKTEIPSIIKWAFVGLERLSNRKHFYIPQTVQKESIYYREQLDPLKTYISEFYEFNHLAPKESFISSKKFVDHFHTYLYRIGQYFDRNRVQKRASITILKNLDRRLNRKQIRNGNSTYATIHPLVPNRDLDLEFISERSEMSDSDTVAPRQA